MNTKSVVFVACTDAYLTPCLKRYIDTFESAFEKEKLNELNVLFMQSDGGLTPVDKYTKKKSNFSKEKSYLSIDFLVHVRFFLDLQVVLLVIR